MPTLLQFNFEALEKEVEEGGDITELLMRFQNILLETGKEIRELRVRHHKSNDDVTNNDKSAPTKP